MHCLRSMTSLQDCSLTGALFLSLSPLPLCSWLMTRAAWQAGSACPMLAAEHHLIASLTGRTGVTPARLCALQPLLLPSHAAEVAALQ